MRLKPLQKETRVFLSMHELQTYLDSCPRRVRIAARIEARASPRIGIVAQLKRKDFYVPDHPDVNIAFVRLRGTKDTRKEENAHSGQFRISWVPWSLYEDVQQYCDDNGIGPDDEIINIGEKRLGDLIKEAAQNTAVKTGNEDYEHVRSHDFRAFYATHMVRRLGVDKELVMEMGGWGSHEAIEPYLATSLPRDLQNELARTGVLERDVPTPSRRDDLGKILDRLANIEAALELDAVVDDVGSLTLSDINELRDMANTAAADDTDDEPDATSLRRFMSASGPVPAGLLAAGRAVSRAWQRGRVERRAMDRSGTAPSPAAAAATYVAALLPMFLAAMLLTESIASLAVVGLAVGGVLGGIGFDFDAPDSCPH